MSPRYRSAVVILACLLCSLILHPTLAQVPGLQDLTVVGRFETRVFDQSAAEITAYDPVSKRLFVVNAHSGIDILDLSNPAAPTRISQIITPTGFAGINSVAVNRGLVAAAVAHPNPTTNGAVFFYNTQGGLITQVPVGVLPDALAFTPDGSKVIVANEAQPNLELTDDHPTAFHGDAPGSITVIHTADYAAHQLSFQAFNTPEFEAQFRAAGGLLSLKDAHLPGNPDITIAQDLEPEYVAVAPDSQTAYVTLQENNAVAVVDLQSHRITHVFALGFKDNRLARNALDPSNRDDSINIRTGPTLSAYCPDGIAAFQHQGHTYLVTANEGDARDFDIRRIKQLTLDPAFDTAPYPAAQDVQADENFGRLEVSLTQSDPDHDGDADRLITFGARSFAIFKVMPDRLECVFDSGDDFEQRTAAAYPNHFNAGNDDHDLDSRSDDAGPEPETIALADIHDRRYAFITLERIGGVMAYDITDPTAPVFLQYINPRDFSQDIRSAAAGDLGPEGVLYISRQDSPVDHALLVVANEVSGSTTLFRVAPTLHAVPDAE